MRAVKGNKEYIVDEVSKKKYLADGFDIVDNDGKTIEESPKKTISLAEHNELKSKYEDLESKYNKLKKSKEGQ